MAEFELTRILFPDLLPWEKEGLHPLFAQLCINHRVQDLSISPVRPRLPQERLGSEPLWIVAKNWPEAVRWGARHSGPVVISVIHLTRRAAPLPFLFLERMRKRLPSNVTLVTHCPLSQRFFLEIEGMSESQTIFLPLPVGSADRRERAPGAPVTVGVLARFLSESNLHYCLNVAHYVARKNPEVHFRILGSGPLQSHLERMVKDLGLHSTQVVAGANASDVATLDCLLFTPLRGDHFIPILLAGRFGIPVLATECPGIDEFILDGQSGFLVPVNETKPMAELVLRLGSDALLRRSMGEKLSTHLSATRSAQNIAPAYEKAFFDKTYPCLFAAA